MSEAKFAAAEIKTRRTRFLEDLDKMLMIDRQGAIDDMLQVLRVAGAIGEVAASIELEYRHRETSGYMESMRRSVGNYIGRFLVNNGHVGFEERPNLPTHVRSGFSAEGGSFDRVLEGRVEVVKRT